MTRLPFALWAIAAALSACSPAASKEASMPYPAQALDPGGEVVAKVGSVVLTTAELEKRIAQQSPFVRAQLKDPGQRQKFVENEVRTELLAQEGWKRGLGNDP